MKLKFNAEETCFQSEEKGKTENRYAPIEVNSEIRMCFRPKIQIKSKPKLTKIRKTL